MAQFVYTTRDGDMLDAICKDYYGDAAKYVGFVLDANPDLAGEGEVYVAGVKIVLPDLPASADQSGLVKLWD